MPGTASPSSISLESGAGIPTNPVTPTEPNAKPSAEPASAEPTPADQPPDFLTDGSQEEAATKASISQIFLNAITNLTAEIQMNVSGMIWEFGAENDLKNIFTPFSELCTH